MKNEMVYDAAFYNKLYQVGGNFQSYNKPYSKSPYFKVWQHIIQAWIDPGTNILDIGCGPGQFAQMLNDKGDFNTYTGIDFSQKAIEMARKKRLQPKVRFYEYDLSWRIVEKMLPNYDAYLALETLEHLETELELKLLDRIPSGKVVILSLPAFQAKGHLRVYPDFRFIQLRYSQLLDIQSWVTDTVNPDTRATITSLKAIKI